MVSFKTVLFSKYPLYPSSSVLHYRSMQNILGLFWWSFSLNSNISFLRQPNSRTREWQHVWLSTLALRGTYTAIDANNRNPAFLSISSSNLREIGWSRKHWWSAYFYFQHMVLEHRLEMRVIFGIHWRVSYHTNCLVGRGCAWAQRRLQSWSLGSFFYPKISWTSDGSTRSQL